jgi:competence protein ComEC
MSKILNMLMAFVMSFGILGSNVNPSDIPENSNFEVHFIDVGQADSALIECDGETMMIDGGNVADSNVVAAYLKKEDVTELNYVVCSHAHEDHVGGLSGALSVTKADNIYAPKTEANTKAYKNFKKKAEEQNVEIKHPNVGDKIQLGSSTVEFLGPVDENGKDLNSTSIVLKIIYGNTSFLFTGDAESDEEEEILNSGADLKSTVLKVGHHGSRTSTSYPFLREVMPQYAVISVEKGNSYGHPNEETLSKLSDAGVEVYRTDESGDIVMTSDGNSINIVTAK